MVPRPATLADAPALAAFARRTFVATFVEELGVPYPAADLAQHLDQAYGLEPTRRLIADPTLFVRVVDAPEGAAFEREGDSLAGYVLAGPCQLPHPEARPTQGELRRLYVAHAWHGRGYGRALMDAAFAWLERTFDGPIWLGVWSGNTKAQAIYRARGFAKVGEYGYPVGAWTDQEHIFRRPAASTATAAAARPGTCSRKE